MLDTACGSHLIQSFVSMGILSHLCDSSGNVSHFGGFLDVLLGLLSTFPSLENFLCQLYNILTIELTGYVAIANILLQACQVSHLAHVAYTFTPFLMLPCR